MDPRFPTILNQRQIDARSATRTLPMVLPSLPMGEWLLAGIALILLISA